MTSCRTRSRHLRPALRSTRSLREGGWDRWHGTSDAWACGRRFGVRTGSRPARFPRLGPNPMSFWGGRRTFGDCARLSSRSTSPFGARCCGTTSRAKPWPRSPAEKAAPQPRFVGGSRPASPDCAAPWTKAMAAPGQTGSPRSHRSPPPHRARRSPLPESSWEPLGKSSPPSPHSGSPRVAPLSSSSSRHPPPGRFVLRRPPMCPRRPRPSWTQPPDRAQKTERKRRRRTEAPRHRTHQTVPGRRSSKMMRIENNDGQPFTGPGSQG